MRMTPILRKLSGRVAVGVALMIEGTLGLATFIGMTTTADDAENLPKIVQWLLGTPWWVPALVIPLALIAFAAWVFRPDQITANAMREYKAANDRAWEFAPEFRAEMDKLAIDRGAFLTAVEEIARLQTTYHNSMADAVDEVSQRYDERAERAVRDVFGRHFENMRIERKFEDEKQMREERRSLQIMVAREVGAVTARLDALPQSPQGTGPETPR